MTGIFKKTVLDTALAATTLATATPAQAEGYRGRGHGDGAGPAIIAGIFGLAIGAIIASAGNDHRNRYAQNGWTWRDGYYWDREGRRYDRDGRPCDQDDGYYRRGYGYQGGGYPGGGYGYQQPGQQ